MAVYDDPVNVVSSASPPTCTACDPTNAMEIGPYGLWPPLMNVPKQTRTQSRKPAERPACRRRCCARSCS